MAKTIVQRIALDGGPEVKAQLEAIGKAGQAAFKKFQDAGAAGAFMNRFGGTIDAIKAKATELGAAARKVGSDFNALGESVTMSARRFAVIGAVIAAL